MPYGSHCTQLDFPEFVNLKIEKLTQKKRKLENNKLSFEVNAVQILQTDQHYFSKLKLQIARGGQNLHDLPITDEALEMSAPSLVGKPILCHVGNGKFGGHDDETIVGVILNKDDVFFENDDKGIKWICAFCYIWCRYFPNVMDIFQKLPNNTTPISMEIDVLSVSERDDGKTWIEAMSFAGVSIIGVTPAIPQAHGTVIEFSELAEEFEHDKQILFSSQNVLTHFPKHGMNKSVHLKNSKYAEFDFDYATSLKSEYPSVWSKGGNLKDHEEKTV